MNFQTIEAMVETLGYDVEFMGLSYSKDITPAINIGLVKGNESVTFHRKCPSMDDLTANVQSLAGFIDWLALKHERDNREG